MVTYKFDCTMKKIFNISVTALALFGAIACSTTSVDEVVESQNVVTASFVESRTALVDGVKTVWSADDKIDVNGVTFSLTSGAGESAAVFTSAQPVEVAQSYTATYPAGVTVVPTTQSAVAGSFDPAAALAVATNSSLNNMLFEYKHALVKFSLPADAAKVELLGYTLAGELKTGTTYYIAIAAGQYDGVVAKVDGVVVKQGQSALNAVNGKIYNLGVLEAEAVQGPGIRTADDLVAFASNPTQFEDANGVVNILANIDMTGKSWTPISDFTGTLEGNNHTIDNLVVENATHAAMFKNLSGATIQNLVFGKGCSFTITGTSTSYAGAVVGQILTSATLKNIKTYATITGGTYMGGICGGADKKGGNILFENCTNCGSVTYPAVAAYANLTVGGIVGQSEKNVVLNNCHNEGSVSNLSNSGNKYNKVGGIAGGASDANMTNCTNKGIVALDVRNSNKIHVGGLVGCLYRAVDVSNCSNSGQLQISDKVTITANALYQIGGCFGSVDGNTSNTNYWKIYKVSNSASFTISISETTSTEICIGGIAGISTLRDAKFEECSNGGNLTAQGTTGTNKVSLAGIVGYMHPDESSTIGGALVYKCENTGAITFNDVDNSVWCYVAGIVGKNGEGDPAKAVNDYKECTIDGCINRGNVTMSSWSKANPAGIISQAQCNVKNCENYGTICTTEAHKDYFSGTAGIVSRLNIAGIACSNCKNYGTIVYQGKGFDNANLNKGIVGQAGVVGLCNYGTVENCENYGTILGNNYDVSLGGAEYKNAQGSIVGWGAYNAAVTIKNCKVGGAVGAYVEADEDFGAAKATAITADNYEDYIYGGNAGNGVTVTDCAFAQSK